MATCEDSATDEFVFLSTKAVPIAGSSCGKVSNLRSIPTDIPGPRDTYRRRVKPICSARAKSPALPKEVIALLPPGLRRFSVCDPNMSFEPKSPDHSYDYLNDLVTSNALKVLANRSHPTLSKSGYLCSDGESHGSGTSTTSSLSSTSSMGVSEASSDEGFFYGMRPQGTPMYHHGKRVVNLNRSPRAPRRQFGNQFSPEISSRLNDHGSPRGSPSRNSPSPYSHFEIVSKPVPEPKTNASECIYDNVRLGVRKNPEEYSQSGPPIATRRSQIRSKESLVPRSKSCDRFGSPQFNRRAPYRAGSVAPLSPPAPTPEQYHMSHINNLRHFRDQSAIEPHGISLKDSKSTKQRSKVTLYQYMKNLLK